jgi:hypothetical protein
MIRPKLQEGIPAGPPAGHGQPATVQAGMAETATGAGAAEPAILPARKPANRIRTEACAAPRPLVQRLSGPVCGIFPEINKNHASFYPPPNPLPEGEVGGGWPAWPVWFAYLYIASKVRSNPRHAASLPAVPAHSATRLLRGIFVCSLPGRASRTFVAMNSVHPETGSRKSGAAA